MTCVCVNISFVPLLSPVEHVAEEDIEPLWQDPGALVLHDPVLHLPEPLLLLARAQGHDRPHQVLEVLDVLKYCWDIFFFSLQNVPQTKHTSGNIK